MATQDHKTGPFSNEDIRVVKSGIRNGWSDEEIAEKINRNVFTVRKYIAKKNLRHKGTMTVENDDVERIKNKFRERADYRAISQMYEGEDLDLVETMWIDCVVQFNEDILATEEYSLLRLIHIQMAINKNRKDSNKAIRETALIESRLFDERMKPIEGKNYDLIAELTTQLDIMKSSLGSFTTELSRLSKDQQEAAKELKANRDVRIKKIEDSKTAFSGYVRYLAEEPNIRQAGRDAELLKMAMENSMKTLAEYHTYQDGKLDRPILSNQTINMHDEIIKEIEDGENPEEDE